MDAKRLVARNLAVALLAGPWTESALVTRTAKALGVSAKKGPRVLVKAILETWPRAYPPSPPWLVEFLLASRDFGRASAVAGGNTGHRLLASPQFNPAPRFAGIDVPRLATSGELAQWLGISIEHLRWYADARRQHRRTATPALLHYTYHFMPKRSGPPRLIEAPKSRLKAIQRRIPREILDRVPPHDCAHGFVAGRSCRGSAQAHAGEALVIAADIREFFPITPLRRVHGIFRNLGYPWTVARLLTGLCSTSAPPSVFLALPANARPDHGTIRLLATPHLPQGAPTSPALANLAAWRLDRRLRGLANSLDGNYTRYADDLAFSGGELLAQNSRTFLAAVDSILRDEGYPLNAQKVRIMGRGGAQRITGLVVNDHLNVPRAEYDRLKAVLHNCRKHGPADENREKHSDFRAHLQGRVTWVENVNPPRGAKLRRMFEEIRW
jgi:RNA-directed DNA polymerase